MNPDPATTSMRAATTAATDQSPDDPASVGPDPAPVAPGYQAALFRAPPGTRLRWRAVRRTGDRLPPADLGVALAQARTLAATDGAAWIVGTDQHTIEIRRTDNPATFTVDAGTRPPRWAGTVQSALTARTSRR